MARNAQEDDRMARLRKRAEMEPSDDEEEGSDQHSGGEEGSEYGGGSEGWDDEEGNDREATTKCSGVEQVRVAGGRATILLYMYAAGVVLHPLRFVHPQQAGSKRVFYSTYCKLSRGRSVCRCLVNELLQCDVLRLASRLLQV